MISCSHWYRIHIWYSNERYFYGFSLLTKWWIFCRSLWNHIWMALHQNVFLCVEVNIVCLLVFYHNPSKSHLNCSGSLWNVLCRYQLLLLENVFLQSLKSHLYLTLKWMLFLWIFISDEVLNLLSQSLKSHLIGFSSSSSKCVRLCNFKLVLYLNSLSQSLKSHLNGFSSKCVRLCRRRSALKLNFLLQSTKSQTNCR